jgi:hypothetical protein
MGGPNPTADVWAAGKVLSAMLRPVLAGRTPAPTRRAVPTAPAQAAVDLCVHDKCPGRTCIFVSGDSKAARPVRTVQGMDSSRTKRRRLQWSGALCAGLLAAGTAFLVPSAAQANGTRVETPVKSGSPVSGITETMVRVKLPLPASVGTHPAACDWLSYLRYRDSGGPEKSADADRILVAQPGILEGAGAFDSVARNTITKARAKGKHIELWALDRRSNCLEDRTGVQAGLDSGNPHDAVDYYYRDKAVGDRKFAGFLGNDQLGWLSKIGLEQTIRDEYDLMAAELPSQAVRKQKMLCGGHSLGGVLTGYFATWDFDGNPATASDAGYNQCAGYFALDTTISTSLADLRGSMPSDVKLPDIGLGYAAVQAGLESGAMPRALEGPTLVNAETMTLLSVAGLWAVKAPNAESDLAASVPPQFNVDTTNRFLFSKDTAAFAAGKPTVEDFRLTNETALGALMDDNSVPLSFIQSSVGFFGGGKIVDKNFPVKNGSGAGTPVFGTEDKAVPAVPHGPLYTWRNYDRVGAAGGPGQTSADGKPFTSAAKEVTDIQELARSLSEQPLDFTEGYFPTKLVTDIEQGTSPQVRKFVVHPDGLKANPAVTLLAGDGLLAGHPPQGLKPVIAPGYQHLDVLTAAPKQNNGKPEVVSTNLARFAAAP